MTMTLSEPFTRKDYMALPEGFPVELIRGELVKEPAPTFGHQGLVGDLHVLLRSVVGRRAVLSPIDVFVDEPTR